MQGDRPPRAAGEADAGDVGVVVGLEDHDVVPGIHQREQSRGDRLGRAGGHQDLAVGVVRQPGGAPRCAAIAWRNAGIPVPGGYWLCPARMASMAASASSRWAVGVRETLAQVDRTGRERQRRHLGEHRRAESVHPSRLPLHGLEATAPGRPVRRATAWVVRSGRGSCRRGEGPGQAGSRPSCR